MNTKQTLALLLVFAFALSTVPAAQAQADDFGSQVQFGDNDFIPTYDAVVAPTAAHFLYVDFGDTGNVQDDALYLNADLAGGIDKDDVRLTAFEGKAAGTIVAQGDTVETGATSTAPANIGFRYADVDENGRYTDGDYVYLVGSAAAVTQLGATTSSAEWTLRLTDSEWGSAGTFVLGGDQDLVVYGSGTGTSAFAVTATGSAATPGLQFGLFNADRSTGANLAALSEGDRLYLDSNPTGTATAADTRVHLSSIRLVGDAGEFGSQVQFGDNDFVPDLLLPAAGFEVIRYEGGDDQIFTDDVVVVDVNAGAAALEDNDIVLSSGGYGGRAKGELVETGDTLLAGQTGTAFDTPDILFADVNNNGRYDEGDYVYLVSSGTTLQASSLGPASYFALRLTDTSGGDAGTFVRSGEQDLIDYGGTRIGIDQDDFAFFDANLNNKFDDGDRAYFNNGAGLVDLYAIRLHGDVGEFGTQVKFGAEDFVPQMNPNRATIQIVRYEAGDDDSFDDDVIVLSSDATADAIERDDLVLTSGSYGGRSMGDFIQAGDTQLVGQGTANQAGLVYVDRNNNNRYDEGDWVYLRNTAAATTLVATGLGETAGTAFSLRLTSTDGGDAGSFVKSGDVDLTNWASNAAALDAYENVGIFDADLDGDISEGDRVYFTTTDTLVELFAIRLVGNFEERTGPGGGGTTPTTPTPTEPTPTEPTPTEPTPTEPTEPTPTEPTEPTTPTEPTGPTDGDDDDTQTPGFELIALVAALGAALVLVRRRN